jgi:hypothetical protein
MSRGRSPKQVCERADCNTESGAAASTFGPACDERPVRTPALLIHDRAPRDLALAAISGEVSPVRYLPRPGVRRRYVGRSRLDPANSGGLCLAGCHRTGGPIIGGNRVGTASFLRHRGARAEGQSGEAGEHQSFRDRHGESPFRCRVKRRFSCCARGHRRLGSTSLTSGELPCLGRSGSEVLHTFESWWLLMDMSTSATVGVDDRPQHRVGSSSPDRSRDRQCPRGDILLIP